MTQDYTGGNAHSQKPAPDGEAKKAEAQVDKKIEKVVVTPVVVKKKGLGRKVKELIIEADFKSVVLNMVSDVLIPAAKNTIFNGGSQILEGMIFGDRGHRSYREPRSGLGPRITYHTQSAHRDSPLSSRRAPERSLVLGSRSSRMSRDEMFVFASRHEAETVLERMRDILDAYNFVTRAELNELAGEPSNHVDNKWGWAFLDDAVVRQTREGFLLDLPPEEPSQ